MANYYIHNNNNITMVKGDTFEFNIFIEEDELVSETGERYYRLKDDDVLYFDVYEPGTKHPVICKEYDKYDVTEELETCYVHVVLEAEDTYHLPEGLYYYTVKLHRKGPGSSETSEGEIDKWITIIQKTKLTLVE